MSNTQQSKGTKRKSASSGRAVAAARADRDNKRKNIVAAIVIVVIAAAVFGGVFLQKQKATTAAQSVIPTVTVAGAAQYPVVLDPATATVLAGKPTAPTTIDAYEDFLCPICGEFESANFPAMEKQLEAGTIKVRYHMLNLLDDRSTPSGYSTMAANTALAVAAAAPDKFIDFHDSLFSKQPEENGPGWTQAQLSNLAGRLGVSGPAFDSVVNGNTYGAKIQSNLTAAEADPALQQQGAFGTPTVVANGKVVNWQQDPNWLSSVVPTH
ncbi:DsbA family protein [Pseudonocardia xinjiangensis]|uniref:DsbA family protein n=1 Tax=Pseudonocardia xinjiangensis TaxID=75289 RepID=A0ABX1R597_9PSEU|nr:DsbA family protein [Pseudonocardia xinjiangensis]NMH75572.1 DsbA family protein [Pseudonocardia xinjiangensis]